MIKGQRVTAKARRMDVKKLPPVKRNGRTVKRILIKLTGSAYCVIESQPIENYKIGDSLKGEIISAEANKAQRGRVSAKEGTSTHKIQIRRLEGHVICVIERPLKYVRQALGLGY